MKMRIASCSYYVSRHYGQSLCHHVTVKMRIASCWVMLHDHHGQVLRQYVAVTVKIESQSYMYGTVSMAKNHAFHTHGLACW